MVIQSVLLVVDNPLNNPEGTLVRVLFYCDVGFTAVFTLEMALKIAVFGFFFNGHKSYLRVPWNILDCFIVVMSLLSIFQTSG